MTEFDQYQTFFTPQEPPVTLVYPCLNTARPYKDKQGKIKGGPAFTTGAKFEDIPAAQKYVDSLQGFIDQVRAVLRIDDPVSIPVLAEIDKDTKKETGAGLIKFKVPAEVERKDGTIWYRQPVIYSPMGEPYPQEQIPMIGGGTTAIISFQMYIYPPAEGRSGVRLEPQIVQVLDLVKYTGRVGDTSGFVKREAPTMTQTGEGQDTSTGDIPF